MTTDAARTEIARRLAEAAARREGRQTPDYDAYGTTPR